MTLSRLGGNAMRFLSYSVRSRVRLRAGSLAHKLSPNRASRSLARSFWVLTGSLAPVAILILFGWATAMSRLAPLPETAWPGAQLLSLIALPAVGVMCAGALVLNASVRLRETRPASRR